MGIILMSSGPWVVILEASLHQPMEEKRNEVESISISGGEYGGLG